MELDNFRWYLLYECIYNFSVLEYTLTQWIIDFDYVDHFRSISQGIVLQNNFS